MTRVLLDTNVVLDIILDREPFVEAAAELWELNREGRFTGYISTITPVNVFYVTRKIKGVDVAQQAVTKLVTSLQICLIDSACLQKAVTSALIDYEDAVQYEAAVANGLDAIVTRNVKDYRAAALPVFSPDDFLNQLKTMQSTSQT